MVVLDRLVNVGESLRLHPLRRVDHQQGALTGGEAPAHLVGEVDMARRVHQVEHVVLPVLAAVIEPHRLRLDRDPPLLLELHIVEHLAGHLPRRQPPRLLDQPVGEGRFPMVDMGYDTEIAEVFEVGHFAIFGKVRRALAEGGGEAKALRRPEGDGSREGAKAQSEAAAESAYSARSRRARLRRTITSRAVAS